MKISISTPRKLQGTVLVVTLTVVAVAAILLGSYLIMVQTQSAAVSRSQTWNSAIAVTEAGLEEAMATINKGAPAIMSSPWTWTNGLSSDGWSGFSGNVTTITRYVYGSNYYTATIDISSGSPVISSIGTVAYTSIPWVFSSAAQPFLATAGMGVTNSVTMGRKVQVTTTLNPLFTMGLVCKSNINANGNGVAFDSYDSSNPLYSTGGQYDSTKRKAGGDVGTDSALVNTVSLGNANIYGTLHTGPGSQSSTAQIGPNGAVGDLNWNANDSGIETGFWKYDMNVNFLDVPAPSIVGLMPGSGNVSGTSYNYVLSNGPYQMSSLSGSVAVTGTNVVLWVTGSVSFSGNSGGIYVAPGASLQMYVGQTSGSGTSVSLAGKAGFNANGTPNQLQFYGLPSVTSFDLHGNSAINAVCYAPEADCTAGGGGNNTQDYQGAGVFKSLSFNGHYNFHYDEHLKIVGPSRGWIATGWKEVSYP